MNIKEIRELLEMIERSGIEEFEIERSGVRLRVKRRGREAVAAPPVAEVADQTPAEAEQVPAANPETAEQEKLHVFRAPIVGTCYLTPKPDAEPLVDVGDRVRKSTVLCIIEAMKLFNQIESDVDGEIVRILVENGQPVEYGEPLFEIRVDS